MPTEPVTASTEAGDGLVRVRVDLAYDGTEFSGWARQPALRTVQGDLEAALGRVLRLDGPVQVVVAGRTDAGVHAAGQVCHVDVPEPLLERAGGPAMLVRRLNGVLAPDVRVHGCRTAPSGFDARFSALWRRYTYRIADGPPDPLRRRDTVAVPRRLDVEAMGRAAGRLLGEHDFAAFCRRREGASTVRELQRLTWARAGDVVVADVLADGFCHSMVRSLVGACLGVGEGRRPEDWPGAVLAAVRRDPGVLVAPAHGLSLAAVGYPSDDGLAERATLTRRRRPPAG